MEVRATHPRLRKVDFVVAVGIWVGFGPELGSDGHWSPLTSRHVCFITCFINDLCFVIDLNSLHVLL